MAIPLRPLPGVVPDAAPPVVPPNVPPPVPGQSAGSNDFLSWLRRMANGTPGDGPRPAFDKAARRAVSASFRNGQFPLLQQLAAGGSVQDILNRRAQAAGGFGGGAGGSGGAAAHSSAPASSSPYSGFMSFLASLRR